ncbi:MAG: hypothetical protein P4M00_19365 [Azospirillaceae bacterium]|nr:hypothetical protein [Azospirillaceae bacterium]
MTKFLVLILILMVVWYGYQWVVRVDAVRRSRAFNRARTEQHRAEAAAMARGAEDMVRCVACGVFVPARGASGCGRSDCPYRRA